MKSKIYSSSCVKTTTKGRTWIPAFLALGFFMAFPVAELIVMGNWSDLKYAPEYVAALYENLWKEGFLYTGLAVSVFAAFFNGVSGFWYLYSPRKVDFYHSLPVKRRQMFWHRAYVGLLYYAVPYLVNVFLAVCIGAMRGFFSLHLMKLAFFMLVIHLLMYCLCYFAVVLVICVTGTVLMGCLMELALFLYGPILGILVEGYERNFFDCYADRHGGLTEILISYGSPVGICRTFAEQYTSGQYGVQLMVLMLAVLIFGVCACAAFTMRKSERTGKSLIYRFSEPVLRILVTIPAGFGIGYIFLMLPNPKSQTPWWIFGMIIGTILAHGILEIIIGMEFKRFFSHKIELVLTGALVAVCACTMKMDLLGYDMYLPKYDRMEEVALNVEGLADYETYNMIEKRKAEVTPLFPIMMM